jgi:Caspase domain
MVQVFRCALLILLVLSAPQAALAARVALVIGNGKYAAATALSNPVNDARDIAAKLRAMGFTVIDGYDLGKRAMEQKIGDFADLLDGNGTGLFYFAGHGIAVNNRNFVLPVDARLDAPAKLKLEALPADDIVDMMGQSAKTSIVILDACRNNPFARSLSNAAKARGVQASEGLTGMQAATGAFIAFSTKPGFTALDGTGRNSPFAEALLRHMDEPGLSISEMMRRVRNDVLSLTQDAQRPQWDDDLTENFSLVPAGAPLPLRGDDDDIEVIEAEITPLAKAEIETLIDERYLKPDPGNVDETVRELFTAEVSSFGQLYSLDALVAIKSRWFSTYDRWDLRMLPSTLTVAATGEDQATAIFDMTYKYWPKQQSKGVTEGRARVSLQLVREHGQWHIRSENSVALK